MNQQPIALPSNLGQKIELYMTIAHECVQNLFDFKSQEQKQKSLFKGIFVYLPVPKKTPVYYFFHKHKSSSELGIEIQRRKQFISKITHQSKLFTNYRLLGGIELNVGEDSSILLMPIRASDIPQEGRKNIDLVSCQQKSAFKPHIVVRTFKNGYPLRGGQTIKLGKLSFFVTQVSAGLKPYHQMIRDGEVLQIEEGNHQAVNQYQYLNQKQHKSQQQDQIQHKVCRYCLDNEQNEEDFMVAVCQCKGTSKFVHFSCLKRWLEQKNKCLKQIEEKQQAPSFSLQCDVCKNTLPKVIVKGNKKYQLLDIFKDQQKFVAFHHVLEGSSWTSLINRYMIPLIKGKPITIGRHEGHTVELQQGTVSRQHAQICINNKDKPIIKDTCSKYGTLLYDPEAKLKLGQKCRAFQIENIVFSFKITNRCDYQ